MEPRPFVRLLFPMAGLIAWAAQFTVVYGATSLACARGHGDVTWLGIGVVPLAVAAATLLAAGATAFVLRRSLQARRRMGEGAPATDRFLNDLALVASGLSLVAIGWQGLPALIVPACA